MPDTTHGFTYPPDSAAMADADQHIHDLCDDIEAKFYPTFTDVTFSGGWTNFGAPYEETSYAKMGNNVQLRGTAKHATGGTTGTVFTLPAGYRPTKNRLYTVKAGAGLAFVEIVASTGAVSVSSYISSGTAASLVFDGVSFDLAA